MIQLGNKISNSLFYLAVVLEDKLGWHPREENSLGDLLSLAGRGDLEAIFYAIGASIPAEENIAYPSARIIYKLRNDLVHYRPIHHQIDYSDLAWNNLCTAMATLVWHLYSEVFPTPAGK